MFSELRSELKAEVDDVWAEVLRHLPLVDGQKDATRVPVELSAVLRTGDRASEGMNLRRGGKTRSSIMASGGVLRIDRGLYPDLDIKKHDKLVALDRDGQPVFEVRSIDDRSHLRLICELGDAS